KLRADPPKEFDGLKVLKFRDYAKDTVTDLATGAVTPTGLPKSNVLYFDIENDSWCCARPSGTEPKIKFYMGIKGKDLEDANAKLESFKKAVVDALEG
ncbi:MAG: phospho-sugar mutase, partial [Lachnospiraceae bacterium]|nr:phospho-sugar mutase [Lachnospiraceae bacterium]